MYSKPNYTFKKIVLMAVVLTAAVAYGKSPEKDNFAEKIKAFGKNGEVNEKNSMVAEILVTRNEKRALDQVNMLIKKYKGSSLEAGLLFRKAELIVRQSKSARFFEFNKSNNKILSMVPSELKSVSSLKKLTEAIAIYNDIERRFPKYEDLDLVLFNNAFLRQQVGQKTTPKEIYYSLIKRFPHSEIIPDTFLSVAEMNYEQKQWKKALEDYESIKRFPQSRVYPYALYKAGWTRFQLKDTDGAIKELESVISESERRIALGAEAKYNLKEEALGDLVLFYSDTRTAAGAYSYFEKWAGKKIVGKYILKLANIYESHGMHQDRANLLTDLIINTPENAHVPHAYRDLVSNDILLKKDESGYKHILAFNSHCEKYFPNEMQLPLNQNTKKEEDIEDEESSDIDAKPNCHYNLAKMSYKLANKWHDDWKKKSSKDLAEQVDKTYRIYIASQVDIEKREKVRFSYAEFNFQREYFKTAMEQYQLTSQNIQDKAILHDASYFAIISLEKYVGAKWSDENENKYVELANFYILKNPSGKYVTDVRYKKSFIDYEKQRYDEALVGFKEIGWKQANSELGLKSQDLYLDILNIQKNYTLLMSSAKELMDRAPDKKRKDDLTNLYRESYFAKAQKYHEDKKYNDAISAYEKFATENKSSRLADQAWWNMIQIYLAQNEYKKAADKSMELAQNFPNSKHVVEALKKAAEVYEFVARPDLVGDALTELAKYDITESKKWNKLSIEFYVIGLQFDKAKKLISLFVNRGESEFIKDILAKYEMYKDKVGLETVIFERLLQKYPVEVLSAKKQVESARLAFDKQNYTEAFRLASKVISMSRKEVPNTFFAEARYLQAQILEKELATQSIRSKLDRLQTVLTIKTEKLDKAQRAYQEAIRYGDPEYSIKSFIGLERCYEGYVSDLKKMKFSDGVSKSDEVLIRNELQKMILPLEDKIVDTLKEGLDYAKTARTFEGRIQNLRNDLNRVNLKLNKIVSYKPHDPEMEIVQ